MESYEFLAGCYDELTADVNYTRWADYIERHFARSKLPIHTVLDLACGTGSLTKLLSERGYEMLGADRSEDMLAQAAEKCRGLAAGEPPIFLHQSMEKLNLYGTIDACVCCLDSVNYVTKPKLLQKAFERVHLFLMPGGLFLFDVNTPEKLRSMDGQVFLDETDDAYCVWRGEFSEKRNICTYGMDIFRLDRADRWVRGGEVHEEYAYELAQLEGYLRDAGFTHIRRYGALSMRAPAASAQRVFFTARKPG